MKIRSLRNAAFMLMATELAVAGQTSCKALPGTPSWPSLSSWSQLNNSLSGRLISTIPPGAVCHPTQPTFNSNLCPAIQAGWLTADFHVHDPVSGFWGNFNNDTCLPEPKLPCSGQGYPVYVVNATSAKDVKKGVDFARRHGVRLIVKGTGHDYLGRSSAPNSLSIWTYNMKGVVINSDSFKPRGCRHRIDTPSVTAKAGASMGDINAVTAAKRLTIVGGGAETVGVGGYLTGGGHSALSGTYGMAADQVLEIELVTPGGAIITANECQHRDIFWATRGGGGSTFGVITAVTIKAYPSTPVAFAQELIGTAPNSPSYWPALAYVYSHFPRLSDLGIEGYSTWTPNFTLPQLNNTPYAAFTGAFFLPVLSTENTTESLTAAFAPIVSGLNSTYPNQFLAFFNATLYPDFYSWWRIANGPENAGTEQLLGSWLLDKEALTSNLSALAEALKTFSTPVGGQAFLVGGKGVREAKPRGGGNAINTAWRSALVHTITGVSWKPLDQESKKNVETYLTNTMVKAMSDLAPKSGAYINEANRNQPDYQRVFWGENYGRLLKIKRAIDPKDVLWCHPCVGNERWEEVGDALCRK